METQTSTRLTGTATVEVTITNVNDNTPSFPQAVYMFSTPEGPSTGVPLSTVQVRFFKHYVIEWNVDPLLNLYFNSVLICAVLPRLVMLIVVSLE